MAQDPWQKEPSQEIATAHPEVEFALVLARTIDSIKTDPEQLRHAIYELARQKLQEQFTYEDAAEAKRLMAALEIAIQGVETHSKKHEHGKLAIGGPEPSLSSPLRIENPDHRVGRSLAVRDAGSLAFDARYNEGPVGRPDIQAFATPAVNDDRPRKRWSLTAAGRYVLVLALVLTIAVAVQQRASLRKAAEFVARIGRADTLKAAPPAPQQQGAAVAEPASANATTLLPTAYGTYAVVAGKLYELDPLPGRVPDPRIAISGVITKPGGTMLPDGHVRFIVFHRDSGSVVPDQAEVRVIAKITQATTFDAAGKPVVSPTEDNWVIRNISIPYRTAPIKEHPEMYEVQPKDDAELTPGRYGLVLKGQAFDFSVEGKITDKRQCLERLAASNGTFYAECQK